MTHSNFKVLIILGKSGSGKGTQVERLTAKYGLKNISSGGLLRARAEQNDFVGKRIKEILAKGDLIPTPIIFHLWLHELEAAREDESIGGVILDGSPRKLYEAWMLEETLQFYKLNQNAQAVYMDISDEEAMRRLLARGRSDDTTESIRSRLKWFHEEVMPAVDFYKERGKLIEVFGERSIPEVSQDVLEKTREFFER